MKRAIIFWDYSNFHATLSQLTHGEWPESKKFDYKKFVDALANGMDLIKVYFACSSAPEAGKAQQNFYDWVDRQAFFYVKQFDRRQHSDGVNREKQVDVYLATQIVALAYEDAYDVAILISGDEDFVPAIEIAQQKGKVIQAVATAINLSDELKRKADRVAFIDKPGDLNFTNFLM